MASPISEMNPSGGDLFGQTAAAQPEAAAKARVPEPKSATIRADGDTVTLSLSAQAKQLKERGESVVEIAKRLNVDVKTLELYLGTAPESPTAWELTSRPSTATSGFFPSHQRPRRNN
jgi:hypothetical protein